MENREAAKQTLKKVFVMLQQLEIPPTEHNVSIMDEVYRGLRFAFRAINTEVQTTEEQTTEVQDEGDKTAD